MTAPDQFGIYILTHRRPTPQHQSTRRQLQRSGYTGPLYLVVDDEDPTLDEYIKNFGDEVLVFPKAEYCSRIDMGDNFDGGGSVIPREAIWDLAEANGHRWHMQLDDDYNCFRWRIGGKFVPIEYEPGDGQRLVYDMDAVLSVILEWFKTTPPELAAVAWGQGGDFIGGPSTPYLRGVVTARKAMNTWICDTTRRFQFPGRRNEDVNAYTELQRRGTCFLTWFQIAIDQTQTQTQTGGMTEFYEQEGTYHKSFTSVMRCPSAVKISYIADRNKNPRIHHRCTYNHIAPKFINPTHRKP